MKTDVRIFDDFFKKKDFPLADKKIAKQIDSFDVDEKISKTQSVARSDDKLTNTINEISNSKFSISFFYAAVTLYDKNYFKLIKFISMLKNFSKSKQIDMKSKTL